MPIPTSTLFPNQFVNARLRVDTMHNAILVPVAAIQRGTQGTFVYVIGKDQAVSMRAVTLGPVSGETVAIEKGLADGEQVVTDGADKLREGAKVEVTTPGTFKSAGQRLLPHRPARARPGKSASSMQQQARGRRQPEHAVNPSRLFILRPVATSLLMVAILLAG